MFSNILTSSLVKFSKFSHSSLSTHRIDLSKKFNEPISPNDLHRAGGIATFMRLPFVEHPEKVKNHHVINVNYFKVISVYIQTGSNYKIDNIII